VLQRIALILVGQPHLNAIDQYADENLSYLFDIAMDELNVGQTILNRIEKIMTIG